LPFEALILARNKTRLRAHSQREAFGPVEKPSSSGSLLLAHTKINAQRLPSGLISDEGLNTREMVSYTSVAAEIALRRVRPKFLQSILLCGGNGGLFGHRLPPYG